MNKNFTQKGLQTRHLSRNCFSWSWCFGLIFLLFSAGSYGQVMKYTFSQAAGTYSAITGGISPGANFTGTGIGTNAVSSAITLPFSFMFDGVEQTQIIISNNGFVTFGATAPTTITYNPIAATTAYNGAITAYGINLINSAVSGATPDITYTTTGTSPNREFVIEFKDVARTGITGDRLNFQIRLSETTNNIRIIYGTQAVTTTTTTATNSGVVGLRGSNNSIFSARQVTGTAPYNTWLTSGSSADNGSTPTQTALGVSNGANGANSMRLNSSISPSSGLTYTWQPVTTSFYQTLPYSQNFNTWSNLFAVRDNPGNGIIINPACGNVSWRNVGETTANSLWSSATNGTPTLTTNQGTGAASFFNYGAVSGRMGYMDIYLDLSPSGNKTMTFDMINGDSGTSVTGLNILLSTDGGATFTAVTGHTTTTISSWTNQTVNLGSATSSTCVLRFQATSKYGSYNLGIDNISVTASSCGMPTATNISSITTTGAKLGWTAPTSVPINGYDIFYSTTNTAPIASTNPTINNNSTTTNTISGLTTATLYYWWVRSDCNSETSNWVSGGSFTTACDVPNPPASISTSAVSSTGLTVNFTAASPAPTGYTLFVSTGNTITTPPTPVNGTTYVNGTSYTFGGQSYTCVSNPTTTAALVLTGASNTQFNYFLFSQNTTNSCSGAPYYSTGVTTTATTCAATPTSANNTSITSSGATLGWTASVAGGGAGTINYTVNIFSDSGRTTHIAGSPFASTTSVSQVVTGLNSNTTYWTRIVANNGSCASGNLQSSFTTLCLPATVESTTPASRCGSGTVTLSATPSSGSAIRWFSVATGGTSLGTSLSFTTPSISATTIYYAEAFNGSCISTRVAVTATVTTPPALTLSSSSASICSGSSSSVVSLTAGASDYDIFNWVPSTNVSGNSTTGWTFNPTAGEYYVLEAINSITGCNEIAGFEVTINPAPNAVTVSNLDATICAGSKQTLTASGGSYTNITVFSEDFEADPTGWTTTNTSTGGTPANAAWTRYLSDPGVFGSNDDSVFIITDSDAQGSGGTTNTTLVSPAFSLMGHTSASLSFFHNYQDWDTDDVAKVQVSTNGTTWTDIQTYATDTGSDAVFSQATINLNSYVGNVSVRLRFIYTGTNSLYWAIDNVVVSASGTAPITWSPTTNLFTDAACTTAYTGTAATTVFAKPSETITYTATGTLGSCSKTDTVTYTVTSATYDPALYSANTPANWSEAPAANKDIVINGNLATSGNLSGCSCMVQSGNVVVNSGHSLVLTNELNVAGGSVTFENNSNLVQTNPVANTGNITYKRNSSALMRLDYTLWSSPVAGQNLKAFSPNTLSPRFYVYDETSTTGNTTTNNGTYVTVLNASNESTYNFISGKGYLIRTPNNHPTTPTVYNGVFSGVPNNGNYSFTLSNALNGYNLVGNPYPSSIDLNAFFTANTAVQSTVWFWRKSNGAVGDGYVTANNLGYTFPGQSADGATNIAIRPGQGFFVKATGAGSVSFNNGMRSTNTTSTFFRNSVSEMPSRIWLQVANSEEVLASALVGYTSLATLGVDAGFDSKPFGGNASLVSLIETEGYAIQGRSSFEVSDQVALGFKAETAGNYSIAIANKDGVFASGQAIYLQDLAQNSTHDFATGAYNFVSGVGTFNNRFRIVYETQTLGIDDVTANNAYVFDNNGVLTVASSKEEIKSVVIYDIQGRMLLKASDINANQWKATAMTKNNQVLLVKVTTATGISTTKTIF